MWDIQHNINEEYDNTEIPDDFKIEVPSFKSKSPSPEPPFFKKYIPNNDWGKILLDEFKKPYFKNIETKFLESAEKHFIYPKKKNIFRAFKLTPISKLKVIILGQDPYPGSCRKTNKPYANGLAFSVNKGCSIPASLRNMYKELERVNIKRPSTGELEPWAKQGVFLINTQLSVEQGNANSHKFWGKFTDNIIKYIAQHKILSDKTKQIMLKTQL